MPVQDLSTLNLLFFSSFFLSFCPMYWEQTIVPPAASTAARAQEASTDAAADLLTMDTGAKQAVDTLLDDLEGSEI